jgi:hypothetical protein
MDDFTKGKIYKIINFTDKQIYVGSTVYSLSERMMYHISKYKRWKSRRTKQYCSSFILFENHEFDNCKIVLLENFSSSNKKELNIREEFYRQKNIEFCVNQRACYQTRIGGIKKAYEWQEKNKEKVKIYKNKSKKKNAERYICECGASLCMGSKRMHLKTKIHQKNLLKKSEVLFCDDLLNLQEKKFDIQFKDLLKTYDRFVKRNEKYENVIMDLTFSQYYFRFGSWYRK